MVVKPAIEPLRRYNNYFRKASVLSYLVHSPIIRNENQKLDVLKGQSIVPGVPFLNTSKSL